MVISGWSKGQICMLYYSSVVKKSGCSSCPATGESEGLKPPFNLKIAHNHIPVFTRLNQLKKYEVIITILFLLFTFMV
jgi:hypothetical protein